MISAAQIRNGRAMLGWMPGRLAKASGFPVAEIRRIEDGEVLLDQAKSDRIQMALESAGIEFIAENGGGAGVRLKKGSVQ